MPILNEDKIADLNVEQGIMQIILAPDSIITLTEAKAIVTERIRLSKNKEYPLYIDIRGVLSVDKSAREYLASGEALSFATAAALHVGSPISKFFGNLAMKIDRPKKPLMMFSDQEKALRWLKNFK